MRITRTGPNRLRFQPSNRGDSFDGELAYDPETFEQPERREIEYGNWRRFSAEISLQFEDKEGPAR